MIKKSRRGVFLFYSTMIVLTVSLFPEYLNPGFYGRITNVHAFIVVSDSMDPVLKVNDLILVRDVNAETLNSEDVITFNVERNGKNFMVTHYYLDTNNGKIRTRSNQSSVPDPWEITDDAIIGKVVFRSYILGTVIRFAYDNAVALLLLMIFFVSTALVFTLVHKNAHLKV